MQAKNRQFQSVTSEAVRRRLSSVVHGKKPSVLGYTSLTPMWAGIASGVNQDGAFEVSISIHDSVYSTDFASNVIPVAPGQKKVSQAEIEEYIVQTLKDFSKEHICKFLGAGVTLTLLNEAPNLCTRLWLELDIVPIVFNIKPFHNESNTRPHIKQRLAPGSGEAFSVVLSHTQSGADTPTTPSGQNLAGATVPTTAASRLPLQRTLDEQADSAARKCLMYYGPNNNPRLTIGVRNQVTVDAGFKIHLIDDLAEYKKTVSKGTWNSVNKYADQLRERKVKIGFFSSTPQGGGVALMRHALIRFLALLDIDAAWYVPNPSPAVFRITKNNHNILQGVAAPSLRLTKENKDLFDQWIYRNSLRWTAEGGPLAPGGVDVVFIDDPQMPGLIPHIKKIRPDVPIIYRSHIEIRSDLTSIPGSPQAEVWEYLWNNIKLADLFISHPVSKFVPADVPRERVTLLGATTDFLDGLNKHLSDWDSQFYMGEFRSLCMKERIAPLEWPARDYIVQVARFDPAKGIPNVIDSYYKFRQLLEINDEADVVPQLLVCGHGAVDDPDASIIYDQVMQLVHSDQYKIYANDIIVMRLPPSDQLLNALLQNSKIVLQLSTREGFEVKVSEALHTGKPVIACNTGGIPLQIQNGKSGYLCEVGDNDAVAQHLFDLYTDAELYRKMSTFAKNNVSDEVGTVGNAAAWLYLAAKYSSGDRMKPNGAWLNDLLREEAGEPYAEGEPKLPRELFSFKA